MPLLARARAMLAPGRVGPPRELVGLVRWAALGVVLLVAGRLIGTAYVNAGGLRREWGRRWPPVPDD